MKSKQESKNSRHTKALDRTFSQENFTKYLNRANTYSSQTIPKIPRRWTTPQIFLSSQHQPNPKQDKDTIKKEKYRPISLMNIDANLLKKYRPTTSRNTFKKPYSIVKWYSPQEGKDDIIFTNE